MSHIVKFNIGLVSGLLALGLTLGGGVWAVATRDSDLTHLKAEQNELKAEVRAELNNVKGNMQGVAEVLTEVRTDIKWLRSNQEQGRNQKP